jgi:hypothetical protein
MAESIANVEAQTGYQHCLRFEPNPPPPAPTTTRTAADAPTITTALSLPHSIARV